MQEQEHTRNCDVIIVTALRVEYQAVRRYLEDIEEVEHPQGTIYEWGCFVGKRHTWRVAIVEIGMGGTGAATETERAIRFFNAHVALFVGVAGGIKDVQRGDVVVARKVYNYEVGKVGEQFQARPEAWLSSYTLVQRAQVDSRKNTWLERLEQHPTEPHPRVFVGTLAAGEKVLASTKSQIYRLLQENFSDTLAIEMEGHGFLDAIQANHTVHGLVIRGISDLIDDKREADAAGFQQRAGQHAAAFTFEILSQLALPKLSHTPAHEITSGRQHRLKKKHEELQAAWDLRQEKIQRIRQALDLEHDPITLFKYEKQLLQEKSMLEKIEEDLAKIEQEFTS